MNTVNHVLFNVSYSLIYWFHIYVVHGNDFFFNSCFIQAKKLHNHLDVDAHAGPNWPDRFVIHLSDISKEL